MLNQKVTIMKFKLCLTIFFCLVLTNFLNAQEETSDVLEKAFKQAANENKNTMVIFHASWCGWCKRMDNNLNDETCKDLFTRNFVITHLVLWESEKNKSLENRVAAALI